MQTDYTRDVYQQAVEWLTENPLQISYAWSEPMTRAGGCLFRYTTPSGSFLKRPDGNYCGCLTLVRASRSHSAWTDELTVLIRGDLRLPRNDWEITAEHLPVFAQWQRHLDRELGRIPPGLDPRLPLPTGNIEIPELEVPLVNV